MVQDQTRLVQFCSFSHKNTLKGVRGLILIIVQLVVTKLLFFLVFLILFQVPNGFTAVMSADRRGKGSDPNIYTFSLELPVTSYLICLAVGDIVSVDIGPRSAVYTEPCLLVCETRSQ